MNKTELIAKVAESAGLTKKDATAAVGATFAAIEEALVKGDKVQLIGFGTNPQTGKAVKIAACTKPAFKAGKALKEAVNK